MKQKPSDFSRRYQLALQKHLKQGLPTSQKLAEELGVQALASGLKLLDLAKIHEQTLITIVLPGFPAKKRASLIRLAGIFFASAIISIGKTGRRGIEISDHLKKSIEALSHRTGELAGLNQKLAHEILRRKGVEASFEASELHYKNLLKESDVLKGQLRRFSRLILSAQEDERKKISRELHDVIAQALVGINVHLSTLKKEASLNTKGLARNITVTQRLVNKSASIVHEFARELRPPVLDDIGLIPALQTFMESFKTRTGLHIHLMAFAAVEQFDISRRTILFRVAQEALTNAGRHANASRVTVTIRKFNGFARMEVHDDGKSFALERVLLEKGRKRLGILGMRERVEMVGGTFCIESSPGNGTCVRVDIPFAKTRKSNLKKSGKASSKTP